MQLLDKIQALSANLQVAITLKKIARFKQIKKQQIRNVPIIKGCGNNNNKVSINMAVVKQVAIFPSV